MKRLSIRLLALSIAFGARAWADDSKPETEDQKSSYAAGVQYMSALLDDGLNLDTGYFLQGMRDMQDGRESRLTPEETKKALDYIIGLRVLSQKALNEKRQTEGADFLRENRRREGVTELPSGLQYKVLAAGDGQISPTMNDGVSIRFRFSNLEGKELLGSGADAAPKYLMKNLIPGWREVLPLMKAGDKWQLFLPPRLAFDKTGVRNGKIKPYQTLINELELVAIVPVEEVRAEMEKAGDVRLGAGR